MLHGEDAPEVLRRMADELAWLAAGERAERQINPLLGNAAGISAFPMAARLAAQLAQDEDRDNFLIMPATAANTGGQIASVIAGGVLLSLVLRLT